MAKCKSCGAPIIFADHHESGNSMPLEEATEEQIEKDKNLWRVKYKGGGRRKIAFPADAADAYGLFPVKLYISHFATCPDAETYRSDDE